MKLTEGFFENILFLFLTAALTGFLIPYILKRIDDRKLREQKEYDAETARQSKLIETQAKFLDDFSQLLWDFRYMCMKVVYHRNNNPEKYNTTKLAYDEQVWDVLSRIRNEISRSRRLVSEKAYQKLLKLYEEIVDLDKRVSALMAAKGSIERPSEESSNLHSFIYSEVTEQIDDVINLLATELRLKAKS